MVDQVEVGKFETVIRPAAFSIDDFHKDIGDTTFSSWRLSMAVKEISLGLATTVQDPGRPGYYHLAIPNSGAIDVPLAPGRPSTYVLSALGSHTVISADMDLIGQIQPITPSRFVDMDIEGAHAARHDLRDILNKLRATLE